MFTKAEFTRLAEKHKDAVFRLAYSLLKNPADADDVVQNTLLRLYQSNKRFESDEHIRNWLMRVAVNECRMIWRSAKHRAESIDDYADTLVFEDEYYGDLFRAIMALNAKYRAVIVLYYYEGYAIGEIAQILRIPSGTVGTRLSRARNILKDYLTEAYQYD